MLMTDTVPGFEKTETRYKEMLEDYAAGKVGSTIKGLSLFIRYWKDQPYFKIEDVLPYIGKAFITTSYRSNLYVIEESMFDNGIQGEIWSKIVNYTINYSLDHNDFEIKDYLTVEAQDHNGSVQIDSSLLKKAQMRVLSLILEDLQKYKSGENFDEETIIKNFRTLLRSIYIPANLIKGLVKRFGTRIYTRIYPTPHEDLAKRIDEGKGEEPLSVYDMAQILNWSGMISKDVFQRMIRLADPEAKEYMRGFLYSGLNKECFILDEEMKPMNIEYQSIELPEKIFHGTIGISQNILTPQELQKWYDIFSEFGIMAQ